MDSALIIEKSVVILVVFALTMIMAMYSTWAERKIAAFLQDRVGPNRAGWGGLLQPLADGAKLFTKEEFFPNTPNRFLFILGPAIAMSTALITSAVIRAIIDADLRSRSHMPLNFQKRFPWLPK